MDVKEVLKKITKSMDNPCFVAESGVWGFDLDWIVGEAEGQAISIFDCPADYRPECEDDWPLPEWFIAEVR